MNKQTIYALGFFDGVHLGHGALLEACRELAARKDCAAGVITFSSHPETLVLGAAPPMINFLKDRCDLLKNRYQMEKVVILPFDKNLMEMPWQNFFRLLTEEYNAAGLVCGYDFRFGNRGEGTASLLKAACDRENIPCVIVPEQKVDGITVSSTYIRRLLETGEMKQANRFLGHPHILTGKVIMGKQLGRTIGIPTANLELPDALVQLKFGVYACRAAVDGCTYLAVTNVGTCPTVEGKNITVESWLLDFDGSLYGKELTLSFYEFLRPEKKFPTLWDLQEEIRKNAVEVRKIFEKS